MGSLEKSFGIGMTVYWDHSTGTRFYRKGDTIHYPPKENPITKDSGRYVDPVPAKIVFWVNRESDPSNPMNSPLTLSEAKEIASYCGLYYDEDLKLFLDRSEQVSGTYTNESLEITIKR